MEKLPLYPSLAVNSGALIRRVLRANGIFSGLSGLLFASAARPLAKFTGLPWPWVLIATGFGLIGYAGLLLLSASRATIDRRGVAIFVVMDIAWVAGSGLLLVTDRVPFTTPGKWLIAILAAIVAAFAILQTWGLRSFRSEEA